MPDTPDILKKILARKREEVSERSARRPLADLEARVPDSPPPRGFVQAIRKRVDSGRPAVIAEIKKASPSRGVIRRHVDPAEIARQYEGAGATCLSVLTDIDFFQGSDEDLQDARDACTLPVLRKDFMIDPYQLYESRVIGADCILLIAAALPDGRLRELAGLAAELDMDALVEVHDREELERGLMLRTPLIGINNRDLRTFETKLDTTIGLMTDVLFDRIVVSESGINNAGDVSLLRRYGVNAFLIGESLMGAPDPGQKLKELFQQTNGA